MHLKLRTQQKLISNVSVRIMISGVRHIESMYYQNWACWRQNTLFEEKLIITAAVIEFNRKNINILQNNNSFKDLSVTYTDSIGNTMHLAVI